MVKGKSYKLKNTKKTKKKRLNTKMQLECNSEYKCGTILFYASSMYEIAKKVKKSIGHDVKLGEIRTGEKSGIWPKFHDGWPNLFIEDHHEIMQKNVVFLSSLDTPESVFEQLAVMFALPKYRAINYKVIIPWFPTGTMERISVPGEIATANTLSRILSIIPMCSSGPCVLGLIDIHALQEQFYFGDNVLVELKTASGLLCKKIDDVGGVPPIIAFPDDGAYKRYKKLFEKYFKNKGSDAKFVICGKERGKGDVRKVVIKEGGEYIKNQCHVIIVDDLVQSGNTLIKCAETIQNKFVGRGKCKISAFVTHGIFPGNTWEKFVKEDGSPKTHISKFYVTDSIPVSGRYNIGVGKKVFEVLSIAPIVEYFISETDCNNEYKSLFDS